MSDTEGNEPAPKPRPGQRNPGASLQQKLRNHAKATGEEVALVLTRYVIERFLYRLSLAPDRDRFILRGATLFPLWTADPHRATRDIDLLASGDSTPEAMRAMLTAVCAQDVPEDGIAFLPETLHLEARFEGRVYRGLHVEMMTALGTARPRLEIDIAFGEAVVPPPQEVELPVLLGMPAPRLWTYQRETVVAEKCEAMVSLGIPNTRMKDFYDLWVLSRTFPFEGPRLCDALRATFTRRHTGFPAGGLPAALTEAFIEDATKERQWRGFVGKTALRKEADALPQVIAALRAFLQPPLEALAERRPFDRHWSPDGHWHA
ncbi:MAG: nucleotidyl transferase AbiEii/AbiGii toxin family protein [Armatimonadetes bacterium]|nr:nucleotidyl transferase AbiEii/AbiGii toxin family protein [Armatimonadota bacterium]